MSTAKNVINVTYPMILRAANQHQTDTGLLWAPPSMRISVGVPGSITSYDNRTGIKINRFELHNRSGGAASVGIGFRLQNQLWRAGTLTGDGATYADITSSVQTSTTAVAVQTAGANQMGFVVGCKVPFGAVSVNFTTAETDAGGASVPDHQVFYNDTANAWSAAAVSTALTDSITTANAVWTAIARNFVWLPPTDWAKSSALSTLPNGYYWLRFTSADREAGDVAAQVTGIEIFDILSMEALADNAIYANEDIDFWNANANGVVAYFSTADAGNRVYAEVQPFM